MTIEIKNECIISAFAIVSEAVNITNDKYVYFNPDRNPQWNFFEYAAIANTEKELWKLFEQAKMSQTPNHFTPIPINFQVIINSVDTTIFDKHAVQEKIDIAMAKLTREDKIALKLITENET